MQIFPTILQNNQESVNLQIINPNKENAYSRIIDIFGNTITEQELPAQNGQSTFKVAVHNLPPNMYFIQVRIGNQIYTEKVICVDLNKAFCMFHSRLSSQ